MIEFKEVSRTFQTNSIKGWVYRITIDEFVVIKRVPENDQLWGHTVLTQIYNIEKDIFIPTCVTDFNKCKLKVSLDEAIKIIEKIVD